MYRWKAHLWGSCICWTWHLPFEKWVRFQGNFPSHWEAAYLSAGTDTVVWSCWWIGWDQSGTWPHPPEMTTLTLTDPELLRTTSRFQNPEWSRDLNPTEHRSDVPQVTQNERVNTNRKGGEFDTNPFRATSQLCSSSNKCMIHTDGAWLQGELNSGTRLSANDEVMKDRPHNSELYFWQAYKQILRSAQLHVNRVKPTKPRLSLLSRFAHDPVQTLIRCTQVAGALYVNVFSSSCQLSVAAVKPGHWT